MIAIIHRHTLPAMYALLPPSMQSQAASALLLAFGLQESKFLHRHQIGGPACGFWQFETAGVVGVLEHRASQAHIYRVLASLRYMTVTPHACATAIEHNDVLAAAFARCLLWTLPGPLAGKGDPDTAWKQYISGWRPGRPHPDTWANNYAEAWARTGAEAA